MTIGKQVICLFSVLKFYFHESQNIILVTCIRKKIIEKKLTFLSV